jgi:hypothetical protein
VICSADPGSTDSSTTATAPNRFREKAIEMVQRAETTLRASPDSVPEGIERAPSSIRTLVQEAASPSVLGARADHDLFVYGYLKRAYSWHHASISILHSRVVPTEMAHGPPPSSASFVKVLSDPIGAVRRGCAGRFSTIRSIAGG